MGLEYEEKLSLLRELIKLSQVDNDEADIEYDFICEVAKKLDIDKDDLETLRYDDFKFTPPKLEYNRIYNFYSLILLMGIDKKVVKKEMTFCRLLGVRMGLNPLAVEGIIRRVEDHPDQIIPSEEIIEIFKASYN